MELNQKGTEQNNLLRVGGLLSTVKTVFLDNSRFD